MKKKIFLVIAILFLSLFCITSAFCGSSQKYISLFSYDENNGFGWRKDLGHVFEAMTLSETIQRMEKFLVPYRPSGEWEDNPQRRDVTNAKFELLRMYQMAEERKKFDQLIEELRQEPEREEE